MTPPVDDRTTFKPYGYLPFGQYLMLALLVLCTGQNPSPIFYVGSAWAGFLVTLAAPAGFWRAGGRVAVEEGGIRHRSTLLEWKNIVGWHRRLLGAAPKWGGCTIILHVNGKRGLDLLPLGVFKGAQIINLERWLAERAARPARTDTLLSSRFLELTAYTWVAWAVVLGCVYALCHDPIYVSRLAVFFFANTIAQLVAWEMTLIGVRRGTSKGSSTPGG